MDNIELNTTQSAIIYLVNHLQGRLLKTQLIKLLFLADIEHWKQTGEQLTDLKYQFYHYGPYDKEYENDLNELENLKLLEKTKINKPIGGYYFLIEKKDSEFMDTASSKIGALGKKILDEIISQYGNTTLRSLLEIVYNHPVMKLTAKNEIIDFNKIPFLGEMRKSLSSNESR